MTSEAERVGELQERILILEAHCRIWEREEKEHRAVNASLRQRVSELEGALKEANVAITEAWRRTNDGEFEQYLLRSQDHIARALNSNGEKK